MKPNHWHQKPWEGSGMEGPRAFEGGKKARTKSRRADENLRKEQCSLEPPDPGNLALLLLQGFLEEH